MSEKIFSYFSWGSSLSVFSLGVVYFLLWLFSPSVSSHTLEISFFGSISLIVIGFGIFSFSSPFSFGSPRFWGILLLGILCAREGYWIFFANSGLNHDAFFYKSSLFNLISYILIASFFIFLKNKKSFQNHLWYVLFVIFTTGGVSVLSLVADFLKIANLYESSHAIGAIGILLADVGLLANLFLLDTFRKMDKYQWVPRSIGLVLCAFLFMFTLGFYLKEKLFEQQNLIYLLLIYVIFGGLVFSVFSSAIVYSWFHSLVLLENLEASEKELENVKKESFQILTSVDVGLWKWDLTNNHVTWDFTISRFFELGKNEIEGPGERILEKIHPDDRKAFREALDFVFRNRQKSECTVRVIWSDQSIHFYTIRGDLILDARGVPIVGGILLDVTALQYSERLLRLSEGVTKTLSKALNLQEGSKAILDLFYNLSGWQILAIWTRDSADGPFECRVVESVPGLCVTGFIESSRALKRDFNEPFLEAISRTLAPVVVEDLGKESKYHRSEIARKEGVKGGLVFPIIEDSYVAGIVELFRIDPYTLMMDKNLKSLLLGIGITIGEFLRRKGAESSEKELIKIVTASNIPIYSCALDGTILTWNPAAEKFFGWKREEIVGKKLDVLIPEDRLDEFESLKRSFQEGRDLIRFSTQRKTKKGKLVDVEISYSILLDQEGNRSRVSIVLYDITEEKAAQEALLRSEEKYRSFVENIGEWIWEIDEKGIFTYSNHAVANILERTPKEIVGQSVYLYLSEEGKELFKRRLEDSILRKKGWNNLLFIWKDLHGKEKVSESFSFPMIDAKGVLIGFRGAERDVTEVKKTEKTKNEFISIVSHEIRAPLSSVHGALGLLTQQTDLSEKAQELIHLAYRNSGLLADLVKDIIDIEKIELGKFEFRLRRIFLAQSVQESVQTAQLISQKTGVRIIVDKVLPEVEVVVDGDRLGQAFGNLLSNAVNFSPPGGTVFVSMEQIDHHVRVTIRDEGPGIPKEFESRIFGRFEQASEKREKQKGTGLGLNIAKTIVEQMGGKIGYLSKPGQGAIFYIEFPIVNTAQT